MPSIEAIQNLQNPTIRAEILKRLGQTQLEAVIRDTDALEQATPGSIPNAEVIMSDAAKMLREQDTFLNGLNNDKEQVE